MVQRDGTFVVYVGVPSAQEERSRGRYRGVVGGLVIVAAVIALVSAHGQGSSPAALVGEPLGSEASKMVEHELAALASVKSPQQLEQMRQQKLLVVNRPPRQELWLNAGAVPDDNAFSHGEDWKSPDDPARPQPKDNGDEYSASLNPKGGLKVVHSTDNGSPVGDSFAFLRTSDDNFHGSAPSPPPPAASSFFTMPKGGTVTIKAPTENGQSAPYKEFDFDTTADDFFTHHPPAATR